MSEKVKEVEAKDVEDGVYPITDDVRPHPGLNIGWVDQILMSEPAPPNPPNVTNVDPEMGDLAGGYEATAWGSGLLTTTDITVDGIAATGLDIRSDMDVNFIVPQGSTADSVLVVVTTTVGESSARFIYTSSAEDATEDESQEQADDEPEDNDQPKSKGKSHKAKESHDPEDVE